MQTNRATGYTSLMLAILQFNPETCLYVQKAVHAELLIKKYPELDGRIISVNSNIRIPSDKIILVDNHVIEEMIQEQKESRIHNENLSFRLNAIKIELNKKIADLSAEKLAHHATKKAMKNSNSKTTSLKIGMTAKNPT